MIKDLLVNFGMKKKKKISCFNLSEYPELKFFYHKQQDWSRCFLSHSKISNKLLLYQAELVKVSTKHQSFQTKKKARNERLSQYQMLMAVLVSTFLTSRITMSNLELN